MDINIVQDDFPKYKIFWVDDKYEKHVVEKFDAAGDDEAYEHLLEYRKNNECVLDQHAYYYGKISYAKVFDIKTKECIVRCIDEDCGFNFHGKKSGAISRFFDKISSFLSYWLLDKPVDLWYWIQDAAYLLKHKEARSNQWSLDSHILDSIELNVPNLVKNSHSLMFLDEAIAEKYGNEPGFELKKWYEEHNHRWSKDLEDYAIELQRKEYEKLLLNVKLYKYYADFGYVDCNDKDAVEFDKEWRHTLPVKLGTYDEFDYDSLLKLIKETWNNIWDWMKLHGHKLYD